MVDAELVDHAKYDRCLCRHRDRLRATLDVCQHSHEQPLARLPRIKLNRCHYWTNPERTGQRHRGKVQPPVHGSGNGSAILYARVLCTLPGSSAAILQSQQGLPKRMKKTQRQRGFSLIELTLVSSLSVMIASALVGMFNLHLQMMKQTAQYR